MKPKFEVDPDLFPFKPHYEEMAGHRVHYVDEGSGPVLLMLHGNPSWSFVYRRLILALRADYRCIALDYPGYGLSVPAEGTSFSVPLYSEIVEKLVDRLDLTNVVVFCQDWAGPIGLAFAERRPERVRAFVIGNTFAWPLNNDPRIRWFSAIMGGVVGRALAYSLNGVVRFFVLEGIRRRLSSAELAMYLAPFADRSMRRFSWQGPRNLIAASDYLAQIEAGLGELKDIPVLLAWASRDFAFREEYLTRFQAAFPNHELVRLVNSGHFWQDDAAEEVAPAIAKFLSRVP